MRHMTTKTKTRGKTKTQTGMPWLRTRMDELEYSSLQQVAEQIGVNRGNLWRYFMLETRPSVALLPAICKALDSTPQDVLRALEVISPREKI